MIMMEEHKEDFDFHYMRDHGALWAQLMDSFREQPALILQVGNGNIEKSADVVLWLVAKVLRHKDAKVFAATPSSVRVRPVHRKRGLSATR